MKKIFALLFISAIVVFPAKGDVESDLRNLFGSGVQIPRFSSFNSYGSGVGNTMTMNNIVNTGGTLAARSEVNIKNAFYNKEGTVRVGAKELRGTWAILGDVHFDLNGNIFNPGASVRGSLAGSIPDSKLIELDLKNLNFGTTDISRCDFSFSDLTGAKLDRAQVAGTDFSFATGLTSEQKVTLRNRGAIFEDDTQKRREKLDKKLIDFINNGGSEPFLQHVIEQGGNINIANENGKTLLMGAAMSTNGLPLVEFLISHGADVHAKQKHGETALILASLNGNNEIIELLLVRGARIDDSNNKNIAALQVAARYGHEKSVETLLNKGASCNLQNKVGWTALMEAASNGHLVVCGMLLEHGCDYNLKDIKGYTALVVATLENRLEVADLIQRHGLQIIEKACGANDDCWQKQLDDRLIEALQNNYPVSIIRYYLKRGANQDIHFGEYSGTPLIQALLNGDKNLVKALIDDHKVNLEEKNKNDDTALMLACWNNKVEIAELLINAGANVDAANKTGQTSLHGIAIKKCSPVLAQLLIENGAIIDIPDDEGLTPFLRASREGHFELVKLLLASGCQRDCADKFHANALWLAVAGGNAELVDFFLDQKWYDINEKNIYNVAPLMAAISNNHPELIQRLINNGADVNSITGNGWTTLMEAAGRNQPDTITMLLNAGADYTLKDDDGETALDIAHERGYKEVAQLLEDWAKAHAPKKEL